MLVELLTNVYFVQEDLTMAPLTAMMDSLSKVRMREKSERLRM